MRTASERRAWLSAERSALARVLASVLFASACGPLDGPEEPGPIEIFPPASTEDLALAFDGTDDYASLGTAGFPFARLPQTLAFWLKIEEAGSADQTVIMLRKDSESGVRVGLCAGALCAKNVSGRSVFALSTTPFPIAEWHHVSYQFDGSDNSPHHTIYLDGIRAATGTALPEKRTPTTAYLGSTDSSELFFSGQLDEFRIWSVARNEQQIATEIAGQAPQQEPPDLVAYYTFDEASGARVVDHSGRGNHALLGDGVASRMPQRVPSGVDAVRP